MQIHLKQLQYLPTIIMMILAMGVSMNFNVIGIPIMSYALLALQLFFTVFAFYLILRQGTITRTDAVYLIFLTLVMFSSLISGTDAKEWLYIALRCCLLLFFFNYYRDNLKPLLLGLSIGFSIAVLAQIYQLITQPELWIIKDEKVLSAYIIAGNYNGMGVCLLINMVVNLLLCQYNRYYYFVTIPIGILCIAIPLLLGSMTAVTCLILFTFINFLPWKRLQRIGLLTLLGLVILFQLLVCFQGNGIENFDLAVWFIEDVLHKDITFTNRTHMWDSALRIISQSWLYGYGYPDAEWYRTNMTNLAIGPHNIMLATLIYGGVIGFGIYLYMLFHAIVKVCRMHDKTSNVVLSAIVIVSLMMLMEVYPFAIIIIYFILGEYYPNISEQIPTIKKGNE